MLPRILTAAVIAIAVTVGAFFYLQRGDQAQDNLPPIPSVDQATPAETQPDNASVSDQDVTILEMAIGDENAPITMIEYASFTCPHCRRFHEDVFGQIKANYVDTGKVRFIARDVYFDRLGLWAAMMARCGGQERFFGIADLIYRGQQEWTDGDDGSVIVQNLMKIGRLAGMNDEQMNACMQNNAKAEALVADYQENSERDDIRSTPSFMINGEKYDNMSYAELAKVLDGLLE